MQTWKRRFVVLVTAVGTALVLLSPADAQEPSDRGDGPFDFTIPSFTTPTFPPPPTMPPPTMTSLPPPPTMPPPTMTSLPPPPTMPPLTLPIDDDLIEEIIETLEGFGEEFQELIDFLRDPLGFS